MSKQILAIALCRVSSLEQLESNSLIHQKDNVLKAADKLGVIIPDDGIWSGHVSSKKGVNYGRKDLKEMLEYCNKHPNVKYLIVQEVDRFMRSPDEQVYFQVKFMNEVGVRIWYADKPELNDDGTLAGLMRYLEGYRAAGSNDERQRKSINGHRKAIEDGRYTFSPKPGYKRGSEIGIQELHPVKGPILRTCLISIVTSQKTPSQALVDLNKSDFVVGRSLYKMDKFRKIVSDAFYAGIVEIGKQVNARNENGLHEAIISKEQHYELVRIMDNKKKTQAGPRKNGNPHYPLSNLVTCSECVNKKYGRFVGFDHGNGVNHKLVYEKYRCRSCGRYLTRKDLHQKVQKQFKDNPINKDGVNDLVKALDKVWKQKEGEAGQEATRIEHKIKSINEEINRQALAAIDPTNSSIKQEIMESIVKKKKEVAELQDQLSDLKHNVDTDKEQFLGFAFKFVKNMGSEFMDISPENRKRCKQIVFPSGFYIDANNKVYTPEISPLIRLAIKKKDTEVSGNSHLVRSLDNRWNHILPSLYLMQSKLANLGVILIDDEVQYFSQEDDNALV